MHARRHRAVTCRVTVENFSFELPGTAKVKGWDGACSDPASWLGLDNVRLTVVE